MSKVVISIDLVGNTLVRAGGQHRLRHHQAGLFLATLVKAVDKPNEQRICAVAVAALWGGGAGSSEPDRTAMRRLVLAVQNGLKALGCDSRVLSMPRKGTVGPWWLDVAPNEQWRVLPDSGTLSTQLRRGSAAKQTHAQGPSLSTRQDPAAVLAVIAALIVADDLARQGHCSDAVLHLKERSADLALSCEGAAVLALRKLRWLRRTGSRSGALTVLAAAQALTRDAHPQARGALAAELALQSARIAYEVDPTKNASKINFERLSQQVDQAGSPKLLWETANLHALTWRRKLQALLARPVVPQLATLEHVAAQAQSCFGTAFYWLAVADDAYHLQAVLVNYAYHLQWPLEDSAIALVTAAPQIAAAVEAWRLSQAVVEKFELPEDSAWDFIMLADLWLGQGAARELIRTDWRLWPSQRSPAFAAFYERAVALAMQTGDARQQALALDRQAAFCKESGNARDANKALQARNALLAADQNLEAQLANEVLWAGGGRNLNLKNKLQLMQTPQER